MAMSNLPEGKLGKADCGLFLLKFQHSHHLGCQMLRPFILGRPFILSTQNGRLKNSYEYRGSKQAVPSEQTSSK